MCGSMGGAQEGHDELEADKRTGREGLKMKNKDRKKGRGIVPVI